MSFTPSDQELIWDIVDAGRIIARRASGIVRADLTEDSDHADVLVRRIMIIGEAVAHLSQAFRGDHDDMPWNEIVGMRNVLVHAYRSIDMDTVWETATVDVPKLLALLEPLVGSDSD